MSQTNATNLPIDASSEPCPAALVPHTPAPAPKDPSHRRRRILEFAGHFRRPEPDQPLPDPQALGDPRRYGTLAPFVDLLQQGVSPQEVLALMPRDIRRALLTLSHKPTHDGSFVGSSWADLDSVLGPITWAWKPWLPNGFLAGLLADQDMGKSILLLRIAACYLRGDPWPDDTPFHGDTGQVLWCEAESGQGLNWDRARRWGLPVDDILSPLPDPLDDVLLDDPRHIQAIANAAARPGVRLVVVDSLTGASRNDINDARMFHIVKQLSDLARDFGTPVMLSHHLRKQTFLDQRGVVTLQQGRGSLAIFQPARAVWAIDSPDPYDQQTRRLSLIKSNLHGRSALAPLGFTIGQDAVPRFCAAPEPPRRETLQDNAADLLDSLLRPGPRRTTELREEFESTGISWATAVRAKKKQGIVSIRKQDAWWWRLPSPPS